MLNIKRCMMLFIILFISLFTDTTVFARTVFRIASYNVENLFDLDIRGTEYPEYIPGSAQGWGADTARNKYRNISRVIRDMHADIITLQEIESQKALTLLIENLRSDGTIYPYSCMVDTGRNAVGCALLSRFEIRHKEDIPVSNGSGRNILKAVLNINGKTLMLYINHWKSKKGPESERMNYARALKEDIKCLPSDSFFLILGDLNSNYNEFMTFKSDTRLNDTDDMTGINHVLHTVDNGTLVDRNGLVNPRCKNCLYNLWLELPEKKRWSYMFFSKKETPDNILMPAVFFDHKGITYVEGSYNRFTADYMFCMKSICRWQVSEKGKGKMTGFGYSDHLPVYADFIEE